MVKDIPPPPRLSARAVLTVGICSDVLVPFLYYLFEDMSFESRTHPVGFELVGIGLMLSIVF